MSLKLLFLLVGSEKRASVRYRATQFFPSLEQVGFVIDCHFPAVKKGLFRKIFASYQEENEILQKIKECDIIFIEKRLFRVVFIKKIKSFGKKIIFDFDDAIMESHSGGRSFLTNLRVTQRFNAVCEASDLILAGNKYLASKVPKTNARVEIFPTVIDVQKYVDVSRLEKPNDGMIRLGWIGQPINYAYLESLSEVFEKVGKLYPNVVLRIISKGLVNIKSIPVEYLDWSEETELKSLLAIDIGLMPLPDDEYAKGKCSLKAIQYMAMGIPVIGSDIGGNRDVIRDRVDGFVIEDGDWFDRIEFLILNKLSREKMGVAAQLNAINNFNLTKTSESLILLIKMLCKD